MKQKRNKPRYNAEFKTFNSEQSCIDVFSKVQSLFLEKFYRYNLSDYFNETFLNIEEDLFLKRIKHKQIKQLASQTFLTKNPIQLPQFQKKLNKFYSNKSEDLEANEMTCNFKKLYSNCAEATIPKDELIFIQVRMRAQIQKIQSLPRIFYHELQQCQGQQNYMGQKDEEQLLKQLKKYDKKVINLFVVYFGDINFHLFNKEHYQPTQVNFFNRTVDVRIHVFYISRIAMLECFKRINRIQNLEYINDLLIQLYEFKRQKARAKRLRGSKKRQSLHPQNNNQKYFKMLWYLKWFGLVSCTMVGIGAFILKFFF